MSAIKDLINRFKPSSYPHFDKKPKPKGWFTNTSVRNDRYKFVQQQYYYYIRITWRLGGLWVFSFLVGFLGLSSMLNGNIHSVVAFAVICLCLALIIPVGVGLYVIGSIAEQHGTWLKDNPLPVEPSH